MSFCENCGIKLDDNAKFCQGCGHKAEGSKKTSEEDYEVVLQKKREYGKLITLMFLLFWIVIDYTTIGEDIYFRDHVVSLIVLTIIAGVVLLSYIFRKEHEFYKFNCPNCNKELLFEIGVDGINCPACERRIVIQDNKIRIAN